MPDFASLESAVDLLNAQAAEIQRDLESHNIRDRFVQDKILKLWYCKDFVEALYNVKLEPIDVYGRVLLPVSA